MIRGVMLDLSRQIERHQYYFDLLPRLAKWHINTLWWHFADDEGFRLKLDGHPELTSPFAFSKPEMRRFIKRAGELGIDVVPEVESLGHASFITRLPQYAHLADGDVAGFNAVCPSRPETIKLLGEVIAEVAELFPSRYFHAGLDEVDFSNCPRCARRGRGRPRGHVFVEHAKAVHRIITGCGKRMIMWADHVEHEPTMLERLPKDIILAHWHYTTVPPEPIRWSIQAGFDVIGCPSLCHAGDVIGPNVGNFQNMDPMAELISRQSSRRALGVVNTWWTTWRCLRDAYLPSLAYTGKLLTGGRRPSKVPFLKSFLAEEFGLNSQPAARALWQSYELAVKRSDLLAILPASPLGMHDAAALAGSEGFSQRLAQMRESLRTLQEAQAKVRQNAKEFAAMVLAVEVGVACLENGLAMQELLSVIRRAEKRFGPRAAPAELSHEKGLAKDILKQQVSRIAAILKKVDAEWNRTRYANDAKGYAGILGLPDWHDSLLRRLNMCLLFLRELLADVGQLSPQFRPDSFIRR